MLMVMIMVTVMIMIMIMIVIGRDDDLCFGFLVWILAASCVTHVLNETVIKLY